MTQLNAPSGLTAPPASGTDVYVDQSKIPEGLYLYMVELYRK